MTVFPDRGDGKIHPPRKRPKALWLKGRQRYPVLGDAPTHSAKEDGSKDP